MLARLRAADLVFSGPGSPSYALGTWRGSPVPEALADKLAHGGAVVFASAAAVTVGRFGLPVYEVYKAGQPVHWLDGLDLLGPLGFGPSCVVVPHFDNAEGGTHDTRFCYMGERRLSALEALLPDDAWILGVDEHTALAIDLDARAATVTGRAGVTVRRHGRRGAVCRGDAPAPRGARGRRARSTGRRSAASSRPAGSAGDPGQDHPALEEPRAARSPLLAEVARLEQAFTGALAARRAADAAEAILALDRTILEWSADTLQSDEPDRARAVLHSLVHRLGETASVGLRDPREIVAPLVERLLALRAELRAERAWTLADRLRDRLVAGGIELHDTPEGTAWNLRR